MGEGQTIDKEIAPLYVANVKYTKNTSVSMHYPVLLSCLNTSSIRRAMPAKFYLSSYARIQATPLSDRLPYSNLGCRCPSHHNNWLLRVSITKTRLLKYIENFTSRNIKISDKKNLIFFIFLLKNIDCGYSLEPPRRGGSNEYPQSMFRAEIRKIMYTPVNPSLTI